MQKRGSSKAHAARTSGRWRQTRRAQLVALFYTGCMLCCMLQFDCKGDVQHVSSLYHLRARGMVKAIRVPINGHIKEANH